MSENFLDRNGLSHLWAKISALFVRKDGAKVLSTNDYTTTEKNKLAGIAAGAQKNQNAFSNVKVGTSTVAADSATDTLEFVAGSNVTLTPDTTNDKVKFSAKDTTYNVFRGATATPAGASAAGLVPAPDTGQVEYFLAGDGKWKKPPQKTYGSFSPPTNETAGLSGLVPAPRAMGQNNVLFGHGWDRISVTTREDSEKCSLRLHFGSDADAEYQETYINAANPSTAGLMLPAEKTKLAGFMEASKYALKSDISGMYKYKGSVTDASKLPTTNRQTGDVYNIETAGQYGGAGMNVAWNGTAWDPLGEIFTVTAITNAQIDSICV